MIYNLFLLIYLVGMIPSLLIGRIRGKRHPSFLQRLGLFLPNDIHPHGIWMHAVSVGEVKALAPLFWRLKKLYPNKCFTITTTTETGLQEAKRILPADFILFSPLDFSFVTAQYIKKIDPFIYLLVEGDFWPNLLRQLKCKKFLVSGKLSSRSFSRWKKIPKIASQIFSAFDLLCVQNEEYKVRFSHLTNSRVLTTGNLKFDLEPEKTERFEERRYLTIASTHEPEEEMLLSLLQGPWTIFLAPRHPERAKHVETILNNKGIPWSRFSESGWRKRSQLILVDTVGQLPTCYANSFAAIVGGSFIPKIGGHNVLEPALYGCPTLFGPYTFSQKELVEKAIQLGSGKETNLANLFKDVHNLYQNQKNVSIASIKGVAQLTMEEIILSIN